MATAYTMAGIVPFSSQPALWNAGLIYTMEFEYTLAGAVVTGDTYTTPVSGLPIAGIRILETELHIPNWDSNATPTATLSVGDAGSATRFINAAIAGTGNAFTTPNLYINQAQALTAGVVSSGPGYLYSKGTAPLLVVTVGGTVATAASTGTMRLVVKYICTEEN